MKQITYFQPWMVWKQKTMKLGLNVVFEDKKKEVIKYLEKHGHELERASFEKYSDHQIFIFTRKSKK